jgi:hypothetical protein
MMARRIAISAVIGIAVLLGVSSHRPAEGGFQNGRGRVTPSPFSSPAFSRRRLFQGAQNQ